MTEQETRRALALGLAVQLHAARARSGTLTAVGDECLSLDIIDTAEMLETYLRDGVVQKTGRTDESDA